jgi:hypothetical protein
VTHQPPPERFAAGTATRLAYPSDMPPRRLPVSIVCVFNDPVVRQECLDRSIEVLRSEAPETEYLPIDNAGKAFPTAGAALNHGVSLARHDYIVFVHQDVYLHSLASLEVAAGLLAGDGGFGVLGAFGFGPSGEHLGHLRDRVILLGEPLPAPKDVDSLDEVLFMAPRSLLLEHPLADTAELAWHAYAVEYGLRVRELGLRVAAADIPLTHNSLTVNLDRLDVAHRAVAARYPDQLPVRTTCGVITNSQPRTPFLKSQRWRYRWLKDSWNAHAARRLTGGGSLVLSDISLDVEDVIAQAPEPFRVFNFDRSGTFLDARPSPLHLHRRGRPVVFRSGGVADLVAAVADHDGSETTLLTNIGPDELRELSPHLARRDYVVGIHDSFAWALVNADGARLPDTWRSRRARPLGMPALSR